MLSARPSYPNWAILSSALPCQAPWWRNTPIRKRSMRNWARPLIMSLMAAPEDSYLLLLLTALPTNGTLPARGWENGMDELIQRRRFKKFESSTFKGGLSSSAGYYFTQRCQGAKALRERLNYPMPYKTLCILHVTLRASLRLIFIGDKTYSFGRKLISASSNYQITKSSSIHHIHAFHNTRSTQVPSPKPPSSIPLMSNTPGCFPFSKLPNIASICNARAPLIVAHCNNLAVSSAGK